MNLFLSSFFLISVCINFSSIIYRYFEELFRDDSIIKSKIYLILSLGFILSFSSLASFNISLHLFGITFSNNFLLIPITIIFLFLKGAPERFGYFMNKDLVTRKIINIPEEIENKSICFELQSNQLIIRNSC